MVNLRVAVHNSLNQLFWLVNALRNAHAYQALAVKTLHIHCLIRGDDNSICRSYFFLCKDIFRTTGAVCFRLKRHSQFCSRLFKRLRSHIRMCNSRRARCNGQYPIPRFHGFFVRLSFWILFFFHIVYDL